MGARACVVHGVVERCHDHDGPGDVGVTAEHAVVSVHRTAANAVSDAARHTRETGYTTFVVRVHCVCAVWPPHEQAPRHTVHHVEAVEHNCEKLFWPLVLVSDNGGDLLLLPRKAFNFVCV